MLLKKSIYLVELKKNGKKSTTAKKKIVYLRLHFLSFKIQGVKVR